MRRGSLRRLAGSLALLGFALAPLIHAQGRPAVRGRWAIGLTLGVSSFTGATEGTGPQGESISFTPYRPTMWGISAAYGARRVRTGVSARYGQAGLAIRGVPSSEGPAAGVLVIAENAYRLASLGVGVSAQLVRLYGGPSLRPSLGLAVERWTAPGTSPRTILGGQAGLAMEVALTRAGVASVEAELGFTPASPFLAADLPEGYRVRSAWRRTLAAGLYWRF